MALRLLVLGGTVFLGRHVVEAALAAGYRITIFTRGLTQPQLFPGVERIAGDRDGGLGPLLGRSFDAVVDTSGFVPRVVAQSAALDVGRYVFVSSVSVYADLSTAPDEASPTLPAPASEDVGRDYGALKAACEQVLRDRIGNRACIVRPGLIGGPHDPTGRFTYWPLRFAEGGDVLAPEPRDAPAQVVDARDLAGWLVRLAADGPGGTYNAVGLPSTMATLLELARSLSPVPSRLVWTAPEQLHDVEPWSELPLWLPGAEHAGMMRIHPTRALAAGLVRRPLAETLGDTLEWAKALFGDPPRQSDGRYAIRTLSREKEHRILARALAGP